MRIVFCLPGNQFSGTFLDCWTNLLGWCAMNGIQYVVSRKYSCNIYFVRSLCLGGDVARGAHQKPWDGKLDYDFIVWLDSDTVFTPTQVERLLHHDVDIVAGIQAYEGGHGLTCGQWDNDFFTMHGYMPHYTDETLKEAPRNEKGLVEVGYSGFGLMVVRRGVSEAMNYPWFSPRFCTFGEIGDWTMEDVSFCLTARELEYHVYIDPEVRVGHLKQAIY